MIEWLLSPVDPARLHAVSEAVAWHGRSMTFAWGVLVPGGVLAARFFKILPGQDWPQELDNHAWWLTHRMLHYVAGLLTLAGLGLVLGGLSSPGASGTHALLGWSVVILALGQFLGGWFRGSKGGPTDPRPDGSHNGDHYDMTPRRLAFEYLHKIGGYTALVTAIGAITSGLWRANAPVWMWLLIGFWWLFLAGVFAVLQRAGRAYDTYQAIWGPDPRHPGNARRPIGIGIVRPGD
ncbi:MAG: cytochrome b561 domain-containing protein [Bosea sp. (in: a-proteobacteria)]